MDSVSNQSFSNEPALYDKIYCSVAVTSAVNDEINR